MGITKIKILTPIVYCIKLYGRIFPESMVKIRFFLRFKRFLNLKNPQTLNEKILYLSLRTDTTEWTRLADKYNVREYIKENGLSHILVPLYGYWEKASSIDFDLLPNSFVLKTVQGSGDIILVKDKQKLDYNAVCKAMDISVKTKYGELEGGKHYMRIKPAIIAESLLVNDKESAKYSSSIIDYKIWCFNGEPQYIWVCCNRDKKGADVMTYDLDWNSYPKFSVFNSHFKKGHVIPKPKNLIEMLWIAKNLAKPFPVVRVDLYNLNGKIYFGEMTFTSFGGLMKVYTDEFQVLAGNMIDLKYKP